MLSKLILFSLLFASGPSMPRMMGVETHEVRKSNYGWSPVYSNENIGVMSVAFMLTDRNDAIIWSVTSHTKPNDSTKWDLFVWVDQPIAYCAFSVLTHAFIRFRRGPRKNGLIKQFLTDVEWGELDFLIVDAPPGTSDEHISIAQYLTGAGVDGAVVVTTPQEMALLDVRKELTFCAKVGIPVLGVVENMAGYICPCGCGHKSDIFPAVTGGAEKMSGEMKVPFLGSIPLDPNLLQSCEDGKCFIETHPKSSAVQPLLNVVASE